MFKFRVQLRHTGTKKLQWPHVENVPNLQGYNIYLGGRFFIAVRRPSKYAKESLVNLGFGRAMLRGSKTR